MKNEIVLKTYEIDYEFIIKNYLDKSLWTKIWNLLVFKDNVFTLQLSSINTKEEKIYFDIKFNKISNTYHWGCKTTEIVMFDLNNMSIEILKQQINGAIFRLVETYDRIIAIESDGYQAIKDSESNEIDYLTDIAKEFLDYNDVTNDDIRNVYIDAYVDDNLKTNDALNSYLNYSKYNMETELLLMICELIKDETRKNSVVNAVKNKDKISEIENKVKEYMEYIESDDWLDEVRDNLVAI